MRRRLPWWVLALLFVVVPLAELFLLIQLGQVVGPWWTILILLADAVLGSWLVKREGGRTWRALQEALAAHRMPASELADGALVLVGGTLLVTPGFLTDLVGLFCILPFTRPVARRLVTRVIARRLAAAAAAAGAAGTADPAGAAGSTRTAQRPGHQEVIRGDVVDG